mgnify:FL=1
MNVKDAAKILVVSDARVRQMLADGTLTGEKFTERGWAIPVAAVRKLAKEREKSAKAKAKASGKPARERKAK